MMICFYMQVFVLYGYSLTVQCLFPLPQHSGLKEWIYRGSMRLEHLGNMVLQKADRAGEPKAAEPSVGMLFFFFYDLSLSIIDSLLIIS